MKSKYIKATLPKPPSDAVSKCRTPWYKVSESRRWSIPSTGCLENGCFTSDRSWHNSRTQIRYGTTQFGHLSHFSGHSCLAIQTMSQIIFGALSDHFDKVWPNATWIKLCPRLHVPQAPQLSCPVGFWPTVTFRSTHPGDTDLSTNRRANFHEITLS